MRERERERCLDTRKERVENKGEEETKGERRESCCWWWCGES